jgi:hypothetical protein
MHGKWNSNILCHYNWGNVSHHLYGCFSGWCKCLCLGSSTLMPDTQLWSSAKNCYSSRISSPSLVFLFGVPYASHLSVSEKHKCLQGYMITRVRSYPSSNHTRHTLHLDSVSSLSYSTASRYFSLGTGMLATFLWFISGFRKSPGLM